MGSDGASMSSWKYILLTWAVPSSLIKIPNYKIFFGTLSPVVFQFLLALYPLFPLPSDNFHFSSIIHTQKEATGMVFSIKKFLTFFAFVCDTVLWGNPRIKVTALGHWRIQGGGSSFFLPKPPQLPLLKMELFLLMFCVAGAILGRE